MVERIKERGRILTVTDQTGKTAMVFLSRTDADAIVGWLKATDQELLARTGPSATTEDMRKALFPNGPPRRELTLGEMDAAIGNGVIERFERATKDAPLKMTDRKRLAALAHHLSSRMSA
jgi:hypothetical protein